MGSASRTGARSWTKSSPGCSGTSEPDRTRRWPTPALLALAFTVQYLGPLAEHWFFLAQANHPQHLYHQSMS